MMGQKKYVWGGMLAALFLVLPVQADEVVMYIQGKAIPLSEFTYYYCQSAARTNESPARYFERFLSYKLKVADAYAQGWDTLPDFRLRCKVLESKIISGLVIDSAAYQRTLHQRFSQDIARLQTNGWVKVEHISLPLSQHASASEERAVHQRIDSIYGALRKGASFSELMVRYAAPKETVPPTNDQWIPVAGLVKEIAQRLDALSVGGYSAPFDSPLGWHIVKLTARKPRLSFDEALPQLRRTALCMPSSLLNPSYYQAWKAGTSDKLPQTALPFKQIRESLLAARWDALHAGDEPLQATPADLARYFDAHKSGYRWTLPHFRGAVIYCRNKKSASAIKKRLKKLPLNEWGPTLSRLAASDSSLSHQIISGVYAIGQQAAIDKAVFKCGDANPPASLPRVLVVGKRLKQPKEYTDVQAEVERDFRFAQETKKLEELKRRYKVEIHQDVIKTVNCSGCN